MGADEDHPDGGRAPPPPAPHGPQARAAPQTGAGGARGLAPQRLAPGSKRRSGERDEDRERDAGGRAVVSEGVRGVVNDNELVSN